MIGYYVHDHGAGHAQRFAAVRRELPELVGLGSGPRPSGVPADRWVALPSDAGGAAEAQDPTASGSLHWAPVRHAGMRARTAAIAAWVAAHDPRALVVDVSVEVALTARLLSVPTVVIAQHGARDDDVHRLAYASAAAVAALWPAGTREGPEAAADRLQAVGPISRFDDRIDGSARAVGSPGVEPEGADAPAGADRASAPDGRRRVTLLLGEGGAELPAGGVAAAIERTAASWSWRVLGSLPGVGGERVDGDAVWAALRASDVVVATAGHNAVAEVAAARRPLIAIPQARPFDEQHAHAALLEQRGLAVACPTWPQADAWPALLERAVARDPAAWAGFHDGGGARRLADVIRAVAAG